MRLTVPVRKPHHSLLFSPHFFPCDYSYLSKQLEQQNSNIVWLSRAQPSYSPPTHAHTTTQSFSLPSKSSITTLCSSLLQRERADGSLAINERQLTARYGPVVVNLKESMLVLAVNYKNPVDAALVLQTALYMYMCACVHVQHLVF